MEAKELRLGNLVSMGLSSIRNINEIHKVEATTLMILTGEVKGQQVYIEPISITREWLLKLGFILKNGDFYIEETYFGVESDSDFMTFFGDDSPSYSNRLVNIKYVHQLQNLYYAITGKEITI